MFSPDPKVHFKPRSAVLTFSAFEQMGTEFGPMLKFLLEKKPSLVLQAEPLHELFDSRNPVDLLAIRFAEKRNYLRGYLPALQKLEREGKIKIEKVQRIEFGSLFLDGFSYCVWRPR